MNEDKKLSELIKWLEGEKYLIDEKSSTMTEKFENTNQYKLSRNIMIDKTISKVHELIKEGN